MLLPVLQFLCFCCCFRQRSVGGVAVVAGAIRELPGGVAALLFLPWSRGSFGIVGAVGAVCAVSAAVGAVAVLVILPLVVLWVGVTFAVGAVLLLLLLSVL